MDPRVNWALLFNAMLSGFLTGTGNRLFLISLPTLAKSLETDMTGISWALIAYPLATVSLALVFGRLGDLYGRQAVFSLGFLVFTLASFLCGLAQNVFHLVTFRFFQGIGAALSQSQARALAMEAVPEGAAGKAQGLMTVAHQTGFLLGPSIGGLIIDYVHWRAIFFFLVPIGAVGIALSHVMKKSSPAQAMPDGKPFSSVDYLGAGLLIATTVSLISVLDRRVAEALPPGWQTILSLAFFASLLSFLIREKKAASPMLDLSLFKIRMFTFSALCLLLVQVTHAITSFVLPFYLQEILYLSPTFMGILYLTSPVFILLLSPLGGHLADRLGPKVPATAGVGLSVFAYLIGTIFTPASHWLLPTLMLALAGLGDGLFSSPNHAAMIGAVPREHRGVATGALQMMFGLGTILGISVGSFMMTTAFRFYSGAEVANAAPSNPNAFVAALNTTFFAAAGFALLAALVSATRGSRRPNPLL